jgi:hypothetical protein
MQELQTGNSGDRQRRRSVIPLSVVRRTLRDQLEHGAHTQRDEHEDNHGDGRENAEQHFGNSGRTAGDASETEHAGDEGNHQGDSRDC